MTTPDNRPRVPPVVGGIYRTRSGRMTGDLGLGYQNLFSDGRLHWRGDGRHFSYEYDDDPNLDLVELVAIAVPVAELEQLRRAQAHCIALTDDIMSAKAFTWGDWLAAHRAGVKS
jgi:hypothetical protein